MTLKRRLARQITLMIVGVVLLGAAGVLGVSGLHQDLGFALSANEELRQIYTIGQHVALARSMLSQKPPLPAQAMNELDTAAGLIELFEQTAVRYSPGPDISTPVQSVHDAVANARGLLVDDLDQEAQAFDVTPTLRAYTALADLSAAVRGSIQARQGSADRRHRIVLIVVGCIAGLMTLASIWIGVRQYRAVVRPLTNLQEAVRRIAAGRFEQRVDSSGDQEYAALAADFNQMAEHLQQFYQDLEHRIAQKSQELVRSERLASVGYLAAGVAHEINNPLGIIAGYGERSLQRLDRLEATEPAAIQQLRQAIGVMCEEAFRCKQITDRLLMLARPGEQGRRKLNLAAIANDVVSSLSGLERFADRRIQVQYDGSDDLSVSGNEGELRQVILNLTINALEATRSGGSVELAMKRSQSSVELNVRDAGRGMDAATLSRVFEPFFSDKRGERPGTGLGLAVVHSIVTDHAGTIRAHSDGPGRGSCFTMALPAAVPDARQPREARRDRN